MHRPSWGSLTSAQTPLTPPRPPAIQAGLVAVPPAAWPGTGWEAAAPALPVRSPCPPPRGAHGGHTGGRRGRPATWGPRCCRARQRGLGASRGSWSPVPGPDPGPWSLPPAPCSRSLVPTPGPCSLSRSRSGPRSRSLVLLPVPSRCRSLSAGRGAGSGSRRPSAARCPGAIRLGRANPGLGPAEQPTGARAAGIRPMGAGRCSRAANGRPVF